MPMLWIPVCCDVGSRTCVAFASIAFHELLLNRIRSWEDGKRVVWCVTRRGKFRVARLQSEHFHREDRVETAVQYLHRLQWSERRPVAYALNSGNLGSHEAPASPRTACSLFPQSRESTLEATAPTAQYSIND